MRPTARSFSGLSVEPGDDLGAHGHEPRLVCRDLDLDLVAPRLKLDRQALLLAPGIHDQFSGASLGGPDRYRQWHLITAPRRRRGLHPVEHGVCRSVAPDRHDIHRDPFGGEFLGDRTGVPGRWDEVGEHHYPPGTLGRQQRRRGTQGGGQVGGAVVDLGADRPGLPPRGQRGIHPRLGAEHHDT